MSYWLIVILVMVASAIIQAALNSKFNRYGKVPGTLTGEETALKMLRDNGIRDVQVTCIKGTLTDHYNPVNKTINLSEEVFYGRSVSAEAVAAHETGHAIQHATGYAPLKIRSSLVPVTNFCNQAVSLVLLLGCILINITPSVLWFGIALFATTTIFSFITLPVEVNASQRAVEWLEHAGITDYSTTPMAKDALRWAAYTYVIAALGSLATLLYYISIARSRD